MPRIIREKYENGVLVERQTEGSNFEPWKWGMLALHLVVATSLAVLAAVAVRDSLALGNAVMTDESAPTSCEEQPKFRS